MTASDTTPPADAAAPEAARTPVGNHEDFSAQLEGFQGPLDLLLYLIRENEVEITEIPIARILDQYLKFLDQATQMDLQLAGEFLVMAASLMEIKSRELLPVQEEQAEGEEIIEDPRSELVRQLLAYRRLKEQAQGLADLQDQWQRCRTRGLRDEVPEHIGVDDPALHRALAHEALLDVDLYALFAAYERVSRAIMAQARKTIVQDKETVEQKIERIEQLLRARPFAQFRELVANPGSRADIAATFVALLELVRRRAVRLMQQQDYGHFTVKVMEAGEAENMAREQAAAAEAASEAAVKAKAEQDALLAAQAQATGGPVLPWVRKRAPARPKFSGMLRTEDVEELDAEESEISRRIDAILAAADAIVERFEMSHDGKVRDEQNLDEALTPDTGGTPAAQMDTGKMPVPQTDAGETPAVQTNTGETPVVQTDTGKMPVPQTPALPQPPTEGAP